VVQTNQALARVGGSGSQSQVQGHVKTQLIAHDKEVYDIAFSRAGGGRDMFASVGLYLVYIQFMLTLHKNTVVNVIVNTRQCKHDMQVSVDSE